MAIVKEYESSPPVCAELDYLDIPSQPGEMSYHQETNASSLGLDAPQPSPLLHLFHSTGLTSTPPYTQDPANFYPPTSHVYPGIDVRSRLSSSTTTATGMAHAHTVNHHPHRPAGLPHPGSQISVRDQYSATTPSFRRATEHPTRSPSFPGAPVRRHPLSPTPSPLTAFPAPIGRMDVTQYQSQPAPCVPPLLDVQTTGTLQYMDGNLTIIEIDIIGTVDKGFFRAEGEWTCYRRNYMACACSYTLNPHYPGTPIQYTPSNGNQTFQVYGFLMCISAAVADNDQHSIDLVQHTPKRDKGPISKPDKIPLAPKNSVANAHIGMYPDSSAGASHRGMYADGFGAPAANGQLPAEHTFERIQFKQATQNNGKRRAAQQYYHLMVELWADLGNHGSEQYVKVAYRKSAKMIVRGRSPGHYQNEKRRSNSSGPGGASGNLGSYSDFTPSTVIGGNNSFATSYDARGPPVYGGARHHRMLAETPMTSEEEKAIDNTRGYQYYPGTIYEGQTQRVDIFPHRSESDNTISHINAESKVKPEYDMGMMPRIFHTRPVADGPRLRGHFDGKPTSNGFFPTMMSPSGTNISIP